MSSVAEEAPTRVMATGDQARVVLDLLREYAGKLAELNKELNRAIELWATRATDVSTSESAWLLDRSEVIRGPLLNILSRATSLQEYKMVDTAIWDVLDLRRTETEVHLHHSARLTGALRDKIDHWKSADRVARLRLAAGLNGMKGGSLRPNG